MRSASLGSNSGNAGATAEAAVGAALSVFAFIAMLPFLGMLALPFSSIASTVVTVHRGLRYGFLSIFAASFIIASIQGLPMAAFLVSFLLLLGLAQGHEIRNSAHPLRILIIGFLGVALFFLAVFFFTVNFMNIDIIANQKAAMDSAVKNLDQALRNANADKSALEQTSKQLKAAASQLQLLLPAILASLALLFAFLNYQLSGRVLRALGRETKAFPAFQNWQFPWQLSWGYLLGLPVVLFSKQLPHAIYVVGLNIFSFFSLLYFVQGMAILLFFLNKKKIRAAGKGFIIAISILVSVFRAFVIWAGIFDVWFDFRKISRENRSSTKIEQDTDKDIP